MSDLKKKEGRGYMPKGERKFTISGNNKDLWCPFKSFLCQRGYCHQCQIYLDWQKRGEMIVICAWCGEVMHRNPELGESVVSHGICLECQQKYFPEDLIVVYHGNKG